MEWLFLSILAIIVVALGLGTILAIGLIGAYIIEIEKESNDREK